MVLEIIRLRLSLSRSDPGLVSQDHLDARDTPINVQVTLAQPESTHMRNALLLATQYAAADAPVLLCECMG